MTAIKPANGHGEDADIANINTANKTIAVMTRCINMNQRSKVLAFNCSLVRPNRRSRARYQSKDFFSS